MTYKLPAGIELARFRPRLLDATRAFMANFPDAQSVGLLQDLGIRAVVLTDYATPDARAKILRRPTEGLPVRVRRDGRTTWYQIDPAR